jgi:hypothetical protein
VQNLTKQLRIRLAATVIASSISNCGVWSDELIYSTRKSSLPNQLSEISTSIKTQLSVIGSNLPLMFFFHSKRKKERILLSGLLVIVWTSF